MRKFIDVECLDCGAQYLDVYIDLEVEAPISIDPDSQVQRGNICDCGSRVTRMQTRPGTTASVHGDDIPGGLDIKHGLCHPDGTPRRFYSKSDIRKAAKEANLTWGAIEHVPDRGSDKNRHTQKWV